MLPIGHSLVGLIIYDIFNQKQKWSKNMSYIFMYIFLANLPDGDFIPVILGFDYLNVFHRGLTHTLLFSMIIAALLGAGIKLKDKTSFFDSFPVFFLLIYSHVIIDIFNVDTRPPSGVMALYPLTDQYFHIPLLPPVSHSNLQALLSIANLKTAIFELSLFFPFLLIIFLRKRNHLKS